MFSIGNSSCERPLDDRLFREYRDAGLTHMEICVEKELIAHLNMPEIKRLSDKYGVKLWSFHLPFMPFEEVDISSLNKNLRQSSVDYWASMIRWISDYGVKVFVVHSSGEPIAEADRAEKMKCAKESLAYLAQIADECGAVIAVENLPRTCLGRDSRDILELTSADPRLRVCFDTNHLLRQDIGEFIHAVGSKIITTHVSDYDLIDERHWLPGEGKIDWAALMNALKEVGYDGPWVYEVGFVCPNTIIREGGDLTCQDFADNAAALFAGEEPPVLCKHIPLK